MGTHFIQSVTPVRGVIDRLDWEVRLATDFHGTKENRAFATHWDGCVALVRDPVAANSAPNVGRIVLTARWTNRDRAARMFVPDEKVFEFSTELPGDALDRIEAFRAGGRLFARLEGKLFLVHKTPSDDTRQRLGPWLDNVLRLMDDTNYGLCAEVFSECKELTRDLWCTEVLTKLRPPGRFVLEALVPIGTPNEEHGRRALGHLDAAQRAFDEGRYEEVGRLVYMAGEALQQLGRAVEARYGEIAQKNIARENSALQALCHPERHDKSRVVGDHDADRPMALHLIASMKSLAAIYLAGPPST